MNLNPFFSTNNKLEAGCDEVGRGCLAGPVVAAAVILPKNFHHPYLTDSKKLTHRKRVELVSVIKQEAVAWAIGVCDHEEVDKLNVLNASFAAMHKALDQLEQKPDFILVDGNRFNSYKEIKHACIIKGDSKYFSIAAASILAKEYRDDLMKVLSKQFPYYGWESNVGYPTKKHREGIRVYGVSPYHRKSFQLLPKQIELFKH